MKFLRTLTTRNQRFATVSILSGKRKYLLFLVNLSYFKEVKVLNFTPLNRSNETSSFSIRLAEHFVSRSRSVLKFKRDENAFAKV